MSEPTTRILDLSDYWNMVRARRWVVVITAVVLAFASATYVLLRPDTYAAQARVVVQPLVALPFTSGVSGSAASSLQPDMGTEAQIVKSVTVADDVRSKLGLNESSQAILKRLSVSVVNNTMVMTIAYQDPNPQVAAQVSQAFAVSYLKQRNDTVAAIVARAIAPLQASIDADSAELKTVQSELARTKDPAKLANLNFQQKNLETSILAATAKKNDIESTGSASQGGEIVQNAIVPNSPSGPNLILAGLLGFFLGAILGCVIAVISGLRENKVGGRDELAHHLGAPVMAVIPRVDGWDRSETAELVTREEPGAPASEAYRTLATNIRFLRSQQPLRILVVTSAMPGEGKSATASNLAVVLAETGLRTVLVDADLRRPRASRFIGVNDRAGLREALDGTRDLVDVIQATDTENLWIVGAGVIPQDPVSLLAGPNADAVFEGSAPGGRHRGVRRPAGAARGRRIRAFRGERRRPVRARPGHLEPHRARGCRPAVADGGRRHHRWRLQQHQRRTAELPRATPATTSTTARIGPRSDPCRPRTFLPPPLRRSTARGGSGWTTQREPSDVRRPPAGVRDDSVAGHRALIVERRLFDRRVPRVAESAGGPTPGGARRRRCPERRPDARGRGSGPKGTRRSASGPHDELRHAVAVHLP